MNCEGKEIAILEGVYNTGKTTTLLCDKVDELVSILCTEIKSGNIRIKNFDQTLYQVLKLRTHGVINEKSSSILLSSCKFFIYNLLHDCYCVGGDRPSSEEHNNLYSLHIIELSFENLIVAGEDEICCDYLKRLDNILKVEGSTQLSKCQVLLTSFECFLNALLSVNGHQKVKLQKSIDLLTNENFLCVFKDLIKVDNHAISSSVLSFVPKIVKITNVYSVVTMLWHDISAGQKSVISFPMKLFLLCGLADFLVSQSGNISLMEDCEFWKLIQEGLLSEDALLRKQALYLLKRAIAILMELQMSIELEIFNWCWLKSHTLKETWEKMFILFEVLEEKQAHLVAPVVQSVLKEPDINNSIQPSWLVVGYIRLMSHDSLQVIKLGVLSFLDMDINYFLNSSKCVILVMFQRLNAMLLYHCHSNNVEWSSVDIALKKWFKNITSNQNLCEELLPIIIDAMTKVQWCTIPLFHVLYNMSLSPATNVFQETDLRILINFLKEATKTQNIFIRGAVQCAILNMVAIGIKQSVNILHIINTLAVFRQKECLKRGLKSWEIAKSLISTYSYKENEIITLLFVDENNLTFEAKARSLVLFVDSGLINPNDLKFQNVVHKYFGVLKDTHKRPYASVEESDKCLNWILHILLESDGASPELFFQSDSLVRSAIPYIDEVVFYIQKRLFELDNLEHFESVQLYINVLQVMSDKGYISVEDAFNLNKLSEKVCFDTKYHAVQRLLALKITVWFIRYLAIKKERNTCPGIVKHIKTNCLSIIKNGHLQLIISKNVNDELLSRNHQVHWGWLLSSYTCSLWSVLQECLDNEFISVEEMVFLIKADDFIELAINSIESGGRESLIPILKVVRYVFPSAAKNHTLYLRFLQFSWESCFELRKIALFWPSIKAWIELTFNWKMIVTGEVSAIYEFAEEILSEGEAVNGLSNVLLIHLRRELKGTESIKQLLGIVIKALVFGLVPRKDQRIERDTYTLIGSLGSDYSVNDLIKQPGYGDSQEVRLCALSVLLGVTGQGGSVELIVSVVKQLMEMDNQLTAKRQRYHGDSMHHRTKHRILQSVLVLHQILANSTSPEAKGCVAEVVKWASVGLQGESQQPSVRYQLEWLLIRALLLSPQLLASFWTLFTESSEERTGSTCSFISVAYHLAATLRDREFTDRCVSEVLPWCMAQQFNIRLYAQVVLAKLWPLDSQVASKYEVVRKSLIRSLNQGNAVRNVEKLRSDFYFTKFHPLSHFTLETIFWELPRLSNIARDEWVPLTTIKDSLLHYENIIPLTNPDESLKDFAPSSWVAKSTAGSEVEVEAFAMQKKFVPWKNMFPELECSSSRTELIVVASLIDKLPNLGGLTRTCEIFTAQCLVVPSLEFTKDKMFSTLSMTAEKHINIIEVKPYDLPKYLREMKNSGYTLVGAEQTASSISLECYKFPKKCVLLLGNEKEGVPVSLLPLLDVCVKVPQLGVIRSLNVHVTGALFVWEYTKQYLDRTGKASL